MQVVGGATRRAAAGAWHLVQFYDSDEYLTRVVGEYLRGGLLRGEPCIVIATAPHRAMFQRWLEDRAIPGSVQWLDASDTMASFLVDGTPDRLRFEATIGALVERTIASGGKVRAYGEMVDLLWRDGNATAALQLEELWHDLGDRHPLELLCAYGMENFARGEHQTSFRAICGAHDKVFPTEEYAALDGDDDRRREVALLQQRARALESEILQRVELESALRGSRDRLALLAEASAVLAAPQDVGNGLARVVALVHGRLGVCRFELGDDAHGETTAAVIAPLVARGRVLGRLVVEAPIDPGDRELVDELARRTAIAIDNARLFEQARDANRRKEEFLAMLGHELRNPLAPIVTALELMKLRGVGGLEREQQVIERQVGHLSRLVEDLLDVTRITRGKVALSKERLEASAVVDRAIELASPLFERAAHQLDVDVPRRGLELDGDPVRLAQVVANLLTNAAKYTDPGGHVRVRAWRDGDEIAIAVRDNGRGIDPDALPHMFELFVQGERPLDRSEGGLGIGLPLAKSLVELHGGRITATSEGRGHGSEFTVRFPAPALSMAATQPMRSLPVAPALPALRVLVVDDNQDAAELVAEALRDAGHEVAVALDGPQALAIAPGFLPDAALVDIGLPLMDGYELATRLRELAPCAGMRLVAVTGYGQLGDRQRSEEVGFHEHLVKPVGVDTLIASLIAR